MRKRKLYLVLLIALLPFIECAGQEKVQFDGIFYILDTENFTASVSFMNSPWLSYQDPGDYVIPESVTYEGDDYSVTSIGDNAFGGSKITSIQIPNSVTSIGENAFWGCLNITSITIPNSVTSIDRSAFYGCTGLTSITIPNSLTSIGQAVFYGCTGLTSITIPNSVTSIDKSAFCGCTGLTSITIPNSVTSIGLVAFSSCSGLTSISVEEGNPVYDSRNNCNAIIETASNTLIAGFDITVIPNSVTSIGEGGFYRCTNLTSITIPQQVTSIGKNAFSGCTDLASISVEEGNPMFDSRDNCNAIIETATNTLIVGSVKSVFPNSVTTIGEGAFSECTGLTSITIPNSITSIGERAFNSCTGLTSVTIPNSVTTIGEGAFIDCTGLTSITIPNSVTTIGEEAFYHTGLTSIYIGSGVTDIGKGAFVSNFNSLTDVYCYAKDVPSTGDNFYSYEWGMEDPTVVIESATLHVPAASLEAYKSTVPWSRFTNILALDVEPYAVLSDNAMMLTFYYDDQKAARDGMSVGPFNNASDQSWSDYRESITSVVFDDSFADCTTLTSTKFWFNECKNLTSISGINNLKTDNVTSMEGMFAVCSSLTSLDVSGFNTANVTNMSGMFDGCSGLTSLDVSGFNTANVTTMVSMFQECSSLTSLDLSNFNTQNVTGMTSMFYGCSSLSSLNLSGFNTANVTNMVYMFGECSGLTSLDLSNFNTKNVTVTQFMFQGCSGLTSLDLSSFNTENMESMIFMFQDCSNLKTIYVGNDWNTAGVTDGTSMFLNCYALVGGKGTTYDENHTDYTYAHIDGGKTNPGYFTDKNAVAVDATFDSMGVLTVGGSTTMADALEAVGGGAEVAKTITAIVWNSTEPLTNSDLQGLDNPNMLIFVNEASVAPDHSNVVIDGTAKEIILKDVTEGNNNWYCPQAFIAEKISYTRTFSQQTKVGVSRGWETIALPFDVQTITHATQGAISPFGNYSGNYHFWLRMLTDKGLMSVQEINANTPYIISMPNSSEYSAAYNLAGAVTFSAENAYVPETEYNFVESENYAMAPIFMYIEANEDIYVLNVGEVRNNHPEGSIFERNYRAIRPFEAATQHMNPSRFDPQYISVAGLGGDDDTTDIGAALNDNGEMKNEKYYDLNGRRVLKPSKGIYIQNGNKVIFK